MCRVSSDFEPTVLLRPGSVLRTQHPSTQAALVSFPRTGLLPPDLAQTKLSKNISDLALVLGLLVGSLRCGK